MNVVDVVAPTLPALLVKLDGYKTKDPQRPFLHLAGAQIDDVSPGFFTRLLNTLIDPNLLSLLFLAGIGGIVFEVFHPGVVLPGALGAVALVTALFGFSVLPTSWAGFALILLGLALLVIDAHVVTPRRAHRLGPDRARGRDGDALPQRARAVQDRHLVRRRGHRVDRRLHGLRAREGGAGAPAPVGDADHGRERRASRAATGSSSSAASSGRPRRTTARRSIPARTSSSDDIEGLRLKVHRV